MMRFPVGRTAREFSPMTVVVVVVVGREKLEVMVESERGRRKATVVETVFGWVRESRRRWSTR